MGKLLRGLWAVLSGISRFFSVVVSLLLLGLLVSIVYRGFQDGGPRPIPERGALMVNPTGRLVEDRSSKDPLEAIFAEPEMREVVVADLVRSIEEGAADPRIAVLVMDLEGLLGPSTSQALEIASAVQAFRDAGKPVVAVGDWYSQSHYLLAAQADHVFLHPMGAIELQGFGVYRSYLREFLDKVKVTMNVFRVGENKSAVEPYLRDDMSEVERAVVSRWLGGLWSDYTAAVETARGLEAGSLDALINDFPNRLAATGGDMAQLALSAGLVDQLLDHQASDAFIAELLGETDDNPGFTGTAFDSYLYALDTLPKLPDATANQPVIAVVPVEGDIIPGESTQGMAGSETVVENLERARRLNNLAAVVLRVNSPGGSVFASDVMRRKVLELKAEGIPVVVSMASVAASGGYYIAAEADHIVAQPTTITGSIGVFAAFPTFERLLDYAGVHTDGVGTTQYAGGMRIDRPVDEGTRQILTSVVGDIYEDFIALVVAGRDLPESTVREIAEGKVWSGRDALEIGLVDELGDLSDATVAAAALADVSDWRVRRMGTPITQEQMFFEELGRKLKLRAGLGDSPWLLRWYRALAEPVALLDSLRDPRSLYLRCLSCSGGI